MPSKKCPIERAQFGFMLTKKMDSALKGGNSRTQTEVQQVVVDHHELREYGGRGIMFCVYCAQTAPRSYWEETLAGSDAGE